MSLLESYTFQNEIKKYANMNQDDLAENIIRGLLFSKNNWDIMLENYSPLLSLLKSLFKQEKIQLAKAPIYPELFIDARLETYLYLVQRALCKERWLCKKTSEIAGLSFEEQVDQLNSYLYAHLDLNAHKYRNYRVTIPTSVLILRIGSSKFCGCSHLATPPAPE